MRDIENPKLLIAKGGLFFILGLLAAGLLIARNPEILAVVLLAIAVWAFCRAYYFAFYVIEKYIDPTYRFAGLGSAIRFLLDSKNNRIDDAK
ncbi:MAG: hypothetical protein AAF939_19405 [Planctomycetota bacterium]